MAHAEETRRQLRAAFIYDQLPLEMAATRAGVPASTAARWKRQAKADGDDWDKARTASMLAMGGTDDVARQVLTDYMVQHKTLLDELREGTLKPKERADILASLADSFNKTVAACRRVMPETNELAVALRILNRLAEFVQREYPNHIEAFLEILEPFGETLTQGKEV
ncbi:DUF1804 family protein [Nitratidesulfovibrio sp.]|uniref:DUF1804 family protein n=1 Tax=Nitratidesulfovibrio sp. TaxID=2802297 RepID=UPI0033405AA8